MVVSSSPFTRSCRALKLLLVTAAAVVASTVLGPQALAHTLTNNGFTLTNEAAPDPATVGKQMTFFITETNNSANTEAFDTGISDFLPAGLIFVSATIDKPGGMCSFDASTGTANCKGFTLQNGKTATILVVVIPPLRGAFTNRVEDSGHAGLVDEPFMVKKSASHNHKHHIKHKHH